MFTGVCNISSWFYQQNGYKTCKGELRTDWTLQSWLPDAQMQVGLMNLLQSSPLIPDWLNNPGLVNVTLVSSLSSVQQVLFEAANGNRCERCRCWYLEDIYWNSEGWIEDRLNITVTTHTNTIHFFEFLSFNRTEHSFWTNWIVCSSMSNKKSKK